MTRRPASSRGVTQRDHADHKNSAPEDGHAATAAGIRIGYARHSRHDGDPALQVAALREAGCEQLFEERDTSPAETQRPQLAAALAALKGGDTFVVWRLDRLGHSLAQLVQIIDDLVSRGIRFRSLSEGIDTGSEAGRRVHQIITALAQSERALISERTRAGMRVAQSQGKVIGRRPALTETQKRAIREAVERGESLDQVAQHYGVHSRTIRRALDHSGQTRTVRPRTTRATTAKQN